MRIGIDLGGTKTEIVALADDGQVLLRRRVASPQGDYAATVRMLTGLVEAAEAELGQRGSIGIGIPGAESRSTGLIKNANSTWLIGQPLKADLQLALGREIRLANDANCFALSEASDGAAAGLAVVFGVILGTGVGGGIVVNGQVIQGANSIAGEWGHCHLGLTLAASPVEPGCYCGRKGCVETYLSGPGLAADHQRVNAQTLSAEAIVANAVAGDAVCEATLQRY
ncbi:MAG TPA: ROK family protein, partial [Rhodocyclaceae bacterium]|nr:ROK family protein [Rhodocyclaceae bacterium]